MEPINVFDLEAIARERLPKEAYGYLRQRRARRDAGPRRPDRLLPEDKEAAGRRDQGQ